MRQVPVLLAVLLLAGCASAPEPDLPGEDLPEETVPAPLDMIGSRCPGVGSWTPSPSACVATLADSSWALSEPVVAIDPNDPDRFAIGAIARAPPAGATDAVGTPPSTADPTATPPVPCQSFGICVFWTEDGGATWIHTNPPAGETRMRGADPALAFGADGLLHFASLMNEGTTGGISYTSTADGKTWSDPVEIVLDQGQDRPWIGAHEQNVVIVWQDKNYDLHASESWNSGAEFGTAADIIDWPQCNVHSAPVRIDDYFTVACSDRSGRGGVLLLQINHGRFEQIDRLPSSPGPAFLADSDGWGAVAAYRGSDGRPKLVYRADGPDAAWASLDLVERSPPLRNWTWYWVGALAVDSGDNAHVLVLGGEGEPCFNAKCPSGSFRHVVHVAVSLETGGRVGQSVLTPAPAGGPERERGTQQYQDDYDSIAFLGERGVAAWGREGLVDWTILAP